MDSVKSWTLNIWNVSKRQGFDKRLFKLLFSLELVTLIPSPLRHLYDPSLSIDNYLAKLPSHAA